MTLIPDNTPLQPLPLDHPHVCLFLTRTGGAFIRSVSERELPQNVALDVVTLQSLRTRFNPLVPHTITHAAPRLPRVFKRVGLNFYVER